MKTTHNFGFGNRFVRLTLVEYMCSTRPQSIECFLSSWCLLSEACRISNFCHSDDNNNNRSKQTSYVTAACILLGSFHREKKKKKKKKIEWMSRSLVRPRWRVRGESFANNWIDVE